MKILEQRQALDLLTRIPNDATPTQALAPLHLVFHGLGFPLRKTSPLTCESMGLEASGGPYTLGKTRAREDELAETITAVQRICPTLLLTLRTSDSILHKKLAELIIRRRLGTTAGRIYARVVRTGEYGAFQDFYRSINKKARNRHRFFTEKMKGIVEEDSPLRHVNSMLRVNLSQPVRQGKPLPPSYLDPRLLRVSAELWEMLRRRGRLRFFVARLKEHVVGYAVVPHFGGRALFSRFMVDTRHAGRGVGNALLLEAIRALWRETRVFQYGYWRGKNPGINFFLERNGFKPEAETLLLITRPHTAGALVKPLLTTLVTWSNRAPRVPGEGLLKALRRR